MGNKIVIDESVLDKLDAEIKNTPLEKVMNWWYNLSDYKTNEFIVKHKLIKPIKEHAIREVYNIEQATIDFLLENSTTISIDDSIEERAKKYFSDRNLPIDIYGAELTAMIKGATEQSIISEIKSKEWIKVEDRLPEKLGYYLVVVDDSVASSRHGVVEIQELYESVLDLKVINKFQDYVTHWMPLPTKP